MATTHHAKYKQHLATWRIGNIDESPDPPLDISEVIDLLLKASSIPNFREYILIYVTGIFEGEYPGHEGEQVQTISYLWHNMNNRTGAVGQAQEIDSKYHPIGVRLPTKNEGAKEWVNFRANFDGHNWLEVWQIEIADY